MKTRILISACLAGAPVRYDGRARPLAEARLADWQARGLLVAFCPEVAGGLPTPRPPAEIEPGASAADVLAGRARILTPAGEDVTAPFLDGAHQALALARAEGCGFALLMEASPSCGSTQIYSGRHDGTRRPGAGVTAELLRGAGIAVFPPAQLAELAARIDAAPEAS